MLSAKRRYLRRSALFAAFALCASILPFDLPGARLATAGAGPATVETYLVPLPEEDIRGGSLALYSGTSDTVHTIISITGAVDGTIVYYDQWEDGFELDLASPAQATTETWGDGVLANGAPPGCSADACDTFGAGDNAALINDVFANPRDPLSVLYDGGDQIGATAPVAVTRAGWALDPGTLLAGAVEVYPTDAWDTFYEVPMGEDSPLGQNVEYTAASIMAASATTVSIDLDGDTIVDQTAVLGAGESTLVPGLNQSATITASRPIQVDLLTGDVDATYAGRWFALLPTSQWATSYFNPVGTSGADGPSYAVLYNPGASALTIDVNYQGGSTTVDVDPKDVSTYLMPASGAQFASVSPFYATVVVDYDDTASDWGFTLVPETRLTTAAVVGWGPGSNDPAIENSSPVWVTAEAATTLYVDYDGDPLTGPNVDGSGDHYDIDIAVAGFQMERLYDGSDNDQTGLKVYTLDGTRVAVAYGQDAATASAGAPALDLGTAVVPLLLVAMGKIGSLSGDSNGNGALDPGEFITYTVTIRNDGTADITPAMFSDALDPNTTYVPNTTTLEGSTYADAGTTAFPFDEGGADLGTLAPGQVVTITYDVQLNDPLPDGINSIVNSAQLNSVGISIEGESVNPVFDPFLEITKTSDVPATGAIPGDTIAYSIVVENTSDTPQDGFTVADVIAPGTSYVPGTTSVTGEVANTHTYADNMESGGYGGSTGSLFWGPDWTEINESDGVNYGDERIVNSGGSLRLRVQDNDGGGEGVSRAVDLSGFDTATLSFDFARSGFDNENDFVVLEATDGGGTWDPLATWVGPGSDPVFLSTSHSLDPYLTAGAAIRFVTSPTLGSSDRFLIDNVVITAAHVVTETRTNAPADPDPLADGAAPNLVVPADPFWLDPGATMTISFEVLVDNPLVPSIAEFTNTVYAASIQQPTFTTAAVTDPVAYPEVTFAKNLLANADEDASGDVTVGDTLTYQLVATNSGDTDLTGVTISDPMVGLSVLSCSPVQPADLALGQSLTCTATYTVTQSDVNSSRIDNVAAVVGSDPAGRPVAETATETVPINPVPAATIVKSLLTDLAGIGAGDVFDYEFVVTNTGNVDLVNVVVTDPLVGGVVSCPQSSLAPNGSMTCSAIYIVNQADVDAGQVANTATVTADDPAGNPVTDDDDELAILEQNASIDLRKSLGSNADEDGSGGVSLGDTLTYEFLATNDGNVTLNNVAVADPLPGLSSLSCGPVGGSSLAPGDQMICTATYSVTQTDVDAGVIENIATVIGTAVSGTDVSDSASASVSASQDPSITLTKSLLANADEDGSGDVSLSDTLTYQFDVVNDGNVTLTVVTLSDPLPGLSVFSCGPDVLPVTMTPGASIACTASYSVMQPDVDAGRIDNTATASGLQPNGLPISDDDDETVFPDRNPSIDLAKALAANADEDGSGDLSFGDTVTYQFVATNDGDVGLDSVTITDPLAGLSVLSCTPAVGSSLAPAASMTCDAMYTVTQGDVDAGEIENTATATGDDTGGGGAVSDQDSVTASTAQNPSISLSKSLQANADEDGSGDVSLGDTLTYELAVENLGDVTLTNVAVDDPLTGGPVACPQPALAPAESMACSASYVVTQTDIDAGSIANTATVTADDPQGNPVADSDDEVVGPPQNPSIVLVKSLLTNADDDGSGDLSAGDTLTYQFEATNDGDVTLDVVTVADPKAGLSPLVCAPAAGSSLATGVSMSCSATYTVTQSDVDAGTIDNTATVTSERPGGDPGDAGDDVADVDNHSVLIPAEPAIQLIKTMAGNADEDGSGDVTVGDTLSYEFLVENTGNVTLSSVGVVDPLIGSVSCSVTTLASGADTTCTGTHVVSLTDADTGWVINTATASGTDPHGTDVADDDAIATAVTTNPGISLTKTLIFNADEDGSGGVSIDDTLTYSFVATNSGDTTLAAVRVADPLAGLSVLSCNPAQPAVLAPAESLTCSAIYSVTQTNVDQGQIINTATAEGIAPDSTLVSAVDSAIALISQNASISLDKFVAGNLDEDGSGGITRDDTLTYQFEATNTGNVTLSSVSISDPLGGLSPLDCVPSQPTVLLPGGTIVCTAEYTVTQTDVDAAAINNTASVNAVDPDSAPVNDTDSVATPIEGSPALTLDKFLAANADQDGTGDVSTADTLTYQFDVENSGDVTLTGVTVTDPMPGLGPISCLPAQGSALLPAEAMVCTADYTVTVADNVAGQIDNTATVVGLAPAGTPTSDDDSETVLTARADVSLFKSPSDATPNVGDHVTFIVSVVNDGPGTATNLVVTDALPAGYTYDPASIAGGHAQDDSGAPTLVWTIATMAGGSSINLTYSATVEAPTGAADEYLNVVQVSAGDTIDPDSTPGNDDGDQSEDDEDNASVTPQQADLSLVKTVSESAPNVGDTVTFTVTVSNAGPDDATGVAVRDVVPAGFSAVSNVTGGGTVTGSTVDWSGLTVVSGGSVVLTFEATVDSPPTVYDNVAEVTASDQFDPDSVPDNDDGDQSEDDEDSAAVVPMAADLSLAKTVSDLAPNVGDVVTFTVAVSNIGPNDATGVAVEDVVPAGYSSIANVSAGGVLVGSTISWSGLTVPSGSSVSMSFEARVDAPTAGVGEYLNVAEIVAADTLDPDSVPGNDDGDQSEDDEDNASVTPQQADLSLVKTVSDLTPNVDGVVTFTIAVANAGTSDATGVGVEDVVPVGYRSVANVSHAGVAAGATVTWTGLTVPAGGSVDLTFEAVVAAPTGILGEYLNVAQVTAADQFDPDSEPNNDDGDQSEDDEGRSSVTPQQADLSLVKSVSDPAPNAGELVEFTVLVSNAGPNDATGVAVQDVVPAGYASIANVSAGGAVVGSTVTWSGLAVTSGDSITLTFDAAVLTPPATYLNTAEVTAADQHDPDSVPGNDDGDQSEDDEDNASVTPQQADLSLVKTVSESAPNVGDTVTFSITVSNAGPNDATGVTIEDVVPDGYSSITSVSGGGNLAGSTVTWPGLAISSGGTLVLTFDASVDAPTGTLGEYQNVAEVAASDQFDPDSGPGNDDGDQSEDDEANASVTPQQADLSLVKTVSESVPNVGDVVTFSITVSNAGPDDATGVAVEDSVPAGFSSIASVSGSGAVVGSSVVWSGLAIASGDSIVLTFDVTVESPPALFGNVAEVTASDQFDPDSGPDNDDGDQSEDDEDNAVVIPQQADLSLTKTVSDATPNVGDLVAFTVRVANAGPDAATGVMVEDVVPVGYSSIQNVSGGGAIAGSTITWPPLLVPSGSSADLTFEATVEAPPAGYLNAAQVIASDQFDPDSTPDNDNGDQSEDDEDNADVAPQQADLSLVKGVSASSPLVGEVITFTVTINNAGPDEATGVALHDAVPAGYGSIGNASDGGSVVGNDVSWSGLSVPSGGATDVTFEAVVLAPPAGYLNVVEVTAADQFDPDSVPGNDDGDQSEDDEDNVGLAPTRSDLQLTKSVSDLTPNTGDVVTFTLTVANSGPDDATGVAIADVVPVGYSSIANISGGGTLAGSTVTWSGLAVSSAGSLDLTFDAVVNAPTGVLGEYLNVAEVIASDQFDPDSTPGNDDGDQSEDDESRASVTPQEADLSLVKSISDPSPNVGDVVRFTVSVSNAGPNDATGVAVNDHLPDGYSSIANISSGGTAVGSTISWSGLTVAAGGSVDLSFDATVDAPPAAYANVAEVTAADQFDPDSVPGNDDGDQSEDDEGMAVLVPQQADLSAAKSVSDPAPNVGDVVTFTVTVSNAGPDAATAVTVEDVVPAGYSSIANVSAAGTVAGSIVSWSSLAIAPGGSTVLTFEAVVDPPSGAPTEYLNIVEVTTADQFDPDSVPGNDDGDQSEDDEHGAAVIPQQADLSVDKAVSDPVPNVGDVVTFAVTVSNAGPDDATGVAVTDEVPAGFGLITNVSAAGTAVGSTVTWAGLNIAAGDSTVVTFDATVTAPPAAYVNIAEITAVDQYDPDSEPDNDDGDQSEDDEDTAAVTPQEADLSLTKSVDDPAPVVGATVTFTITLSNAGPAEATGVAVADEVPPGYSSITGISGGGSAVSSTVSWSGLTVPADSSVDLTFEAVVNSPTGTPGEYGNVVEVVTADQFDPDSTPGNDDGDQSEDDEALAAAIPATIGLAKTVTSVANRGNGTYAVTFLLTLQNLGGVAVTDLELIDDLASRFAVLSPSGFMAVDGSLRANTAWSGTSTSNILADGESLDAGESGTVEVSLMVEPGGDLGPHYNSATVIGRTPTGGYVFDVSTDGIDPDFDGDDSDGTVDDDNLPDEDDPTPVSFDEAPALGTAKRVSAGPVGNGNGTFDTTFTLVVVNSGDVTLDEIQVVEDLGSAFAGTGSWALVDVVSSEFSVSPTFDGVLDQRLLTGRDSLAVGASGSIDLFVQVEPGPDLGPYWNSVTARGTSPAGTTVADISQDGVDPDPDGNGDPSDNDDPTPITFFDLGTVSGAVWLDVDSDGAIGATESGLEGVVVTLVAPGPDGVAGSADDIVIDTTETSADGAYTFADIPAGDYMVVVDPTTVPAELQATFDPDGVLDGATRVEVRTGEGTVDVDFGYVGFNLRLTKTAVGARQLDEELDFTIVVTNDGPAIAPGPISMADVVPIEFAVTGVTAPGWSCTSADQRVECLLPGDLAVGETGEFTIHTIVRSGAGGNVVNTARVVADGAVEETDLTDNSDSARVSIGELPHTGADLLPVALVGLFLLLAGAALLSLSQRRRRQEEAIRL